MIVLSLLAVGLISLAILAVRSWYLALCGLALLTVLTNHPRMPANIGNVQGLNPWNAILIIIMVSWLFQRRQERLTPPVPPLAVGLAIAYCVMVFLVTVAAILDAKSLAGTRFADWGRQDILVDGLINPLKYTAIGLLFFIGAANLQRVRLAMLAAVGSGMLYAALMFKSMNVRVFTIDYVDARRLTDKLVGLFANDLALVIAFAISAGIVLFPLLERRWMRLLWVLGIAVMIPPFIALKSRAGFLAFCMIWLVLGLVRWRRVLLLLPVAVALTFIFVPSVQERVLSGFGIGHHTGIDWNTVSAGRLTNIWPPVIDQIKKSPLIGGGRYAMLRKECFWEILALEGEVPSHPHNAYLEILVDAGALGLLLCLTIMAAIIYISGSLMRVRGNPTVALLGVVSLIASVGLLTAAIPGAGFYPSESFVPYLVVWGTALRVYSERRVRPMAVNTSAPALEHTLAEASHR